MFSNAIRNFVVNSLDLALTWKSQICPFRSINFYVKET